MEKPVSLRTRKYDDRGMEPIISHGCILLNQPARSSIFATACAEVERDTRSYSEDTFISGLMNMKGMVPSYQLR